MLHMLRTRDHLDVMMFIVDLRQLGVQMFGVSLCELEDRVYVGLFKQFGILPYNTLDPKNYQLVSPIAKSGDDRSPS
jgi:hypothetical protein